jgi:Protein of unknown function (DUF3341)
MSWSRNMEPELHGIIAEFRTPEQLLEAARRARSAGYCQMDAYSPMPVEGLSEAIGFRTRMVERLVFCAGLLGATAGFGLCWWMTVVAYPHNVAGRPLNSWPAYVAITFEMMVLVSCVTAVIGMLALNGLPQPYHPVFNVTRFEHASRDRFFLCLESGDPQFDRDATREFLCQLGAEEVLDVEQ